MAQGLALSGLPVIRPSRSIWPSFSWHGTRYARGGRMLQPERLLVAGRKYGTPISVSVQLTREDGLTDRPASRRHCRCRRQAWADLPLCIGGPEPNGEWVHWRGADWRVDPDTGKRVFVAAHALAQCWGSGPPGRRSRWAVPVQSCVG